MPWDLDSDFTLENFLVGGVEFAKGANPDKYSYSGYDTGLDTRIEFSLTDGCVGKNVIIFVDDMGSSAHIDYKKKD